MASILSRRFQELADQMAVVSNSARDRRNAMDPQRSEKFVDMALLVNWKVKARSLLTQACGAESVHIQQFTAAEGFQHNDFFDAFRILKAVFEAAREDFDGGYLNSIRDLVRAEVFASELDQADELFRGGYHTAAAVIAGTVLETTVRALCDLHNVPPGKLNRMNDDLAKAGAYNALEQKRVTAMAAIRNAAAHGQTTDFTQAHVEAMLGDVARFVSAHS
jgi:hypothetical protein